MVAVVSMQFGKTGGGGGVSGTRPCIFADSSCGVGVGVIDMIVHGSRHRRCVIVGGGCESLSMVTCRGVICVTRCGGGSLGGAGGGLRGCPPRGGDGNGGRRGEKDISNDIQSDVKLVVMVMVMVASGGGKW